MAIVIEYKGMKIKCSTPREAAELAKALMKRGERTATLSSAPTQMEVLAGAGGMRAAAFLQAIREAGAKGITSQDLANKLGLESPKGLGMVFAMLDRYLQGQTGRDLIARKRSPEGDRIWKMRDRTQLDLALQSMEENGAK